MYADLEKIEARGKRKKEKRKGLFSSFGQKDEPEPSPEVTQPAEKAPEPTPEVKPQPKPAPPEPKAAEQPKPQPVAVSPPSQPVQQPDNAWKPLTGGKLKKAEDELLAYKKWLNKGYKSGVLTKEQCTAMVWTKEIELGLRPPE